MNTGYAFRSDGTSHPAVGSFEEELVEDCIPYIDSRYRTISDKEHRAIAGLSMGVNAISENCASSSGFIFLARYFSAVDS